MDSTKTRRVTKLLLVTSIGVALICPAQTAPGRQSTPSSDPTESASATVDLYKSRLPIAPLPALWHFHPGDDPKWVSKRFDDSGWSLLRSDRSWAEQGFDKYSGYGWYRFQIQVPASMQEISFTLPEIFDVFEVFADGEKIGGSGEMPPRPRRYTFTSTIYTASLPMESDASVLRRVTIAIRVWCKPVGIYHGGGPTEATGVVGETSQLQQYWQSGVASAYWSQAGLEIVALLRTLTALGALVLFLLRRNEPEYLWFSLMTGCYALRGWLFVGQIAHSWDAELLFFWIEFIFDIASLVLILFYLQLLKAKLTWLLRVIVVITLLEIPSAIQSHLFPESFNPAISNLVLVLLNVPSAVYILVLLLRRARLRTTAGSQWLDARLLLVPYISGLAIQWFNEAAYLTWDAGLQHRIPSGDLAVIKHPFEISLSQITGALSLLGVFSVLVLRFVRTRGEEERYATEVEGARSVQQFLIPDDLPSVVGLKIESDYRPALEVGGDFFQIIPDRTDGSVLVIVGDVAGKGLQAGMLATLLVGSFRTASTFTRDPLVILSTLNKRLCGNGNATAVALRMQRDGSAILVNAGHLPPYVNGVELPMEGALPLGTIAETEFPVLHFDLHTGDTLTLISDGILEAQGPSGELFGFSRISEHIRRDLSASSLAEAAQSFGQSDDITVLTLKRLGDA